MELAALTERVIGCAILGHRTLGPGFLESLYERALEIELRKSGMTAVAQKLVPVFYAEECVGEHRLDLLVEDLLVVELKAIKALEDVHFAQVRSYLKACRLHRGLLLNFSSMPLTIKRVLHEPA